MEICPCDGVFELKGMHAGTGVMVHAFLGPFVGCQLLGAAVLAMKLVHHPDRGLKLDEAI